MAKLVPGVNDLATLYPDVAKEADGWDPGTVTAGSRKKLKWRCEKGHTWNADINNRTPPQSSGCPFCSGNLVLRGFNDLATLFPDLAKEAEGWDPSQVTTGSSKKLQWHCSNGHVYNARIQDRTPPHKRGCPYCAGKKTLPGFNDLATIYPKIASQAYGWDPIRVTANSNKKQYWICEDGHLWQACVNDRTPPKSSGCPFCSGRRVQPGKTDLATLFPALATEADGWDPGKVKPGSEKELRWHCNNGHTWYATPHNRIPPSSTGCPTCAEHGFKQALPAWFYLLSRPGEQQVGVSNEPEIRLKNHARNGWNEVEVVGPFPGDQVLATEKAFKKWLRKEVGLVSGTHENWFTARLEVQSLAELKARSGVETDLF